MFGHQDQTTNDNQDIPDESIHGVLNDQPQDTAQHDEPAAPANDTAQTDHSDQPQADDWQHPGVPLDEPSKPISDVMISPAGGFPKAPSFPSVPAPDPVPSDNHHDSSDDDSDSTHELIDIKQHALDELSPLIDDLDLPPEDKFRTIMMMIQASDNQHLVKLAYETAHTIEDHKARAQALLDIVNEINYFTQQPSA
jgi:hypothetical protein